MVHYSTESCSSLILFGDELISDMSSWSIFSHLAGLFRLSFNIISAFKFLIRFGLYISNKIKDLMSIGKKTSLDALQICLRVLSQVQLSII
ncbi:hypothetical protein BpHYR1_040996 [Brachionus plicatilis]|uniref:Uncharacterized protein n=1 Tax=Brachionus plicatilis TaxID=10195 RepID=A0A3M7PEM1_BRAPC|nr:hypothetical protein BpHYR1_040996 [Brachionus plicatilis]